MVIAYVVIANEETWAIYSKNEAFEVELYAVALR